MEIIFERNEENDLLSPNVTLYLKFNITAVTPDSKEKLGILREKIINLSHQYQYGGGFLEFPHSFAGGNVAILTKNKDDAHQIGKLWQAECEALKIEDSFEIISATPTHIATARTYKRFTEQAHRELKKDIENQNRNLWPKASYILTHDQKKGYELTVFNKNKEDAKLLTNMFSWWLYDHTEEFCTVKENLINVTLISNNKIMFEDKIYALGQSSETAPPKKNKPLKRI